MQNLGGDDRVGADGLVAAIQELSLARTLPEIHAVVRRAARRINRSEGSSLALLDGSFCHYVEEEGVGPGWKGRHLPVEHCLSGWSITRRRPVVVPDVRSDLRLPVAPYWSTPVASLVVVPVRSQAPIGALASYWGTPRAPTGGEVRRLQALADTASVAIEAAVGRADMERRVRERTAELEEVNTRLQREIAERRRAEEEVRQLSLIDELTGLYNRRGFMLLAGRELKSLQRSGRRALVLYLDLDGLKQANDSLGHDAGDRLLARAAATLRSVTRDTDVAARIGGDEFAVFLTLGYDHPPVPLIVERFLEAARRAEVRWSVGATATPPGRVITLEDLLSGADEAMYRGRRARRTAGTVGANR